MNAELQKPVWTVIDLIFGDGVQGNIKSFLQGFAAVFFGRDDPGCFLRVRLGENPCVCRAISQFAFSLSDFVCFC